MGAHRTVHLPEELMEEIFDHYIEQGGDDSVGDDEVVEWFIRLHLSPTADGSHEGAALESLWKSIDGVLNPNVALEGLTIRHVSRDKQELTWEDVLAHNPKGKWQTILQTDEERNILVRVYSALNKEYWDSDSCNAAVERELLTLHNRKD